MQSTDEKVGGATKRIVFALAALLFLVTGYGLRFIQDRRAQQASVFVDPSWVEAARGCWKGFRAFHDSEIALKLADPTIFRTTFEEFSAASDQDVLSKVGQKHIWSASAIDLDRNIKDTGSHSTSKIKLPPGATLVNDDPPAQDKLPSAGHVLNRTAVGKDDPWHIFCTIEDGVPTPWQSKK